MYSQEPTPLSTPWKIETLGLEPVPDDDRYGSPHGLFWVWFAANCHLPISSSVPSLWSYGLSLVQSLVAIAAGVAAFFVIGYLGIPGRHTGLPTMAYSSRYFGRRGNRVMALVSWVNLLGWETVVLIIATYAVATILHLAFGTPSNALWFAISLALSAFLELSVAFFGHALLERFQAWVSYIFGFLTLLVLVSFLPHVNWHAIGRPSGSWIRGESPRSRL